MGSIGTRGTIWWVTYGHDGALTWATLAHDGTLTSETLAHAGTFTQATLAHDDIIRMLTFHLRVSSDNPPLHTGVIPWDGKLWVHQMAHAMGDKGT